MNATTTALATVQPGSLPALKSPHAAALPQEAVEMIQQIALQRQMVLTLLDEVLVEGKDYGTIPGTDQPTLLQPGAQKIVRLLRLRPRATTTYEALRGDHRDYKAVVELIDDVGEVQVTWTRSCNTLESKYRYRYEDPVCPQCGETAIRANQKFGEKGGHYCWKKIGGCGATFRKGEIRDDRRRKIENPDVAEQWSTVEAMAQKRAFVNACNAHAACSDVFTVEGGGMENEEPDPEIKQLMERLEAALDVFGADNRQKAQRLRHAKTLSKEDLTNYVQHAEAVATDRQEPPDEGDPDDDPGNPSNYGDR